jgi:hypothetical protein
MTKLQTLANKLVFLAVLLFFPNTICNASQFFRSATVQLFFGVIFYLVSDRLTINRNNDLDFLDNKNFQREYQY